LLIIWLALLPALLSGCASFGRGVTEAIMDRQSEDTRQCWIEGREFDASAAIPRVIRSICKMA
jgi:hypothetical protein